MTLKTLRILLTALIATFTPGCISMHLQKLTNTHAKTFSDVYEKQVLDNLAMFVVNPNATPFFSVPGQSQNTVGSQGNIELGGGKEVFFKYLSLKGNQDRRLSGTMTPVTDANRLRLMQCAYQRAVGAIEQPCQQCTELESAWFGRNNSHEDPCNITCGWLRTSKQWRDVPKCCRNRYGSHCGVYVWVDPCQTEEFSRLVLLMIEYATGKYYPKDIAKTTVQFYVNSDMSPGSKDNHSTVITVEGNDEISVAELRDKFGITLALAKDKSAAYALIDDILKSGKASKTDVDNIKSSLNKGSRKLDFLDNIEGSKVLDLSELQKFKAIQEELNQERSGLLQETPAALPPTRTPIDFGPPTQFNSILGGGILQLRQQLDAGRRSE